MAYPTSPLAPSTTPQLKPMPHIALASVQAGIRYTGRTDLLLITLPEGTQAAGVFTRSLTASAPVEYSRSVCEQGHVRALVINSGNSNAFTGKAGVETVQQTAAHTATLIGCQPDEVAIASTGVIGEPLPTAKLLSGLDNAATQLQPDGWMEAATTIMTTDTFPKCAIRHTRIGDCDITIQGFAKGSGMIAPDMATMLGFIFTDAALPASLLRSLLVRASDATFNCITVDSDTSTSDTVLLCATQTAQHATIDGASDPLLAEFKEALHSLCEELAILIVKDGEGARKLIEVRISGARDARAAHRIGMAIANSPLIKTMVAGEDPNWGRLVMAVGKSGEWADRDKLQVWLGDQCCTQDGARAPDYDEAKAKAYFKGDHIIIRADVGVGDGCSTVWTCDLTEQYIRINADYRS